MKTRGGPRRCEQRREPALQKLYRMSWYKGIPFPVLSDRTRPAHPCRRPARRNGTPRSRLLVSKRHCACACAGAASRASCASRAMLATVHCAPLPVGQIPRRAAVAVDPTGYMRTEATHGYDPTREAPMAAFAKSWRGERRFRNSSKTGRKIEARAAIGICCDVPGAAMGFMKIAAVDCATKSERLTAERGF